jgi:predicted nucleic acid-binding protein
MPICKLPLLQTITGWNWSATINVTFAASLNLIEDLIRSGLYLSCTVIDEALKRVGEQKFEL